MTKCTMKYCRHEAIENTNRCEKHTINETIKPLACECGKPSKYSDGKCGSCYIKDKRLIQKQRLATINSETSISTPTPEFKRLATRENNGLQQRISRSRRTDNVNKLLAVLEGMPEDAYDAETKLYELVIACTRSTEDYYEAVRRIRDNLTGLLQERMLREHESRSKDNKDDYWKNAWS